MPAFTDRTLEMKKLYNKSRQFNILIVRKMMEGTLPVDLALKLQMAVAEAYKEIAELS